MAFHVVSVVPDATRLLERGPSRPSPEWQPRGDQFIFRSERPLIASLVDLADPVTRKLGWRNDASCSSTCSTSASVAIEQQFQDLGRVRSSRSSSARNQKQLLAVGLNSPVSDGAVTRVDNLLMNGRV
jgi:hypothetical protein